jgi:hypothetical protein
MNSDPDQAALEAVAAALSQARHGPATCAAMMRLAGQALARFTSHDRACQVHTGLARRHAERAARCWRP